MALLLRIWDAQGCKYPDYVLQKCEILFYSIVTKVTEKLFAFKNGKNRKNIETNPNIREEPFVLKRLLYKAKCKRGK